MIVVSSAAMRVAVTLLCLLAATAGWTQAPDPGRKLFETVCASCHGGDAHGRRRY